jgi:hypothetical protein
MPGLVVHTFTLDGAVYAETGVHADELRTALATEEVSLNLAKLTN